MFYTYALLKKEQELIDGEEALSNEDLKECIWGETTCWIINHIDNLDRIKDLKVRVLAKTVRELCNEIEKIIEI
jgi:hypothetical protein